MKTYFFYIHDDRYSVPTFRAAACSDDRSALAMAEEELSASSHHQAVDVFDDEERMLSRLIGGAGPV